MLIKNEKSRFIIGCMFALLGGAAYAVGGSCGQALYLYNGMEAGWLVPVRMLISGFLMLSFCSLKKQNIFSPFKRRHYLIDLIIFALIGTTLSQLGFYASVQYSNVAFATVFAYASAVFVLIYEAFHYKRLPYKEEVASIILVIFGILSYAPTVIYQNLQYLQLLFYAALLGLWGGPATPCSLYDF
ncbi:MAG: DMT family transporter [Succinivibrio sp.]|nr:DMT family transporter [Succinivibrio sp.]